MPELLLAIDVGTSTARAALFSPGGALTAIARARLTSVSLAPGRVEQDALRVWRTVKTLARKVLADAGRTGADVAAIGLTTQRASAVVWDRRTGRPVSPLVIWSDLRGVERAAELRAAGFFIAPQQAAAKLEAILSEVETPAEHLAFGNIDAFLIWQMSGGAVHATDASQAWPLGYLDLATMGWNQALMAHQGLDERLFPRLVDTWGPIATTTPAFLGAAIPVAADIADQQSALIAHGETAKVTFGTSATFDLATGTEFLFRSPTAPPFVLSRAGGETRFCVEGMVLSAGSALDWLRGVCRLGNHARFEALAASVADTGGAWFLPALQGLGAPHGDVTRRATLGGLTSATTQAHIARAALEGVTFRLREVFDHVHEATGVAAPDILGVDGGLTTHGAFLQIQADILARPIRRHAAREATACGAAICAGRGIGLLTGADEAAFTRYDAAFEPTISAEEADARFTRWRANVYTS